MEQTQYRKLSEMIPNPKNPREWKGEKEIDELAKSISDNPDFFAARPILLSDRTGVLMIIGGERRWEAAKKLGLEEAPSYLFHGLTEAREDEIMIRDNTHSGEWTRAKLDEWQRHLLKEWGLKIEDFKASKKAVDDFRANFNKFDNKNCEYPIVPMYDEDAEVFIVLSRSEIDSNWFREKFNMNKMKSYKSNEVFKVNVISMEDLKKCL